MYECMYGCMQLCICVPTLFPSHCSHMYKVIQMGEKFMKTLALQAGIDSVKVRKHHHSCGAGECIVADCRRAQLHEVVLE